MNADNVESFISHPPAHDPDAYLAVHYERAAIHEGVPIATLVNALNRAGLTVSNVAGRGLVIHAIGQHPERPAPEYSITSTKEPA